MHNVFANQIRARAARPSLQSLDATADDPAVPAAQGDRLALAEMARALDRLPDDQRRVVLLVALEGLAYQDVAQIMDVPIGTVMSRLSRARERLRTMTADEAGPSLRRVK